MAISARQKHGARYRRIAMEMYSDEKFRALSPMIASGQSLWIYLLTGPFSTLIPGFCIGGEAGMAEALGWTVKAFRRCFAEIETRGMALADWRARVVFLPNAVRYNPPQSPSVVTGWRQTWAEVPACALKEEAAQRIRAALLEQGTAYADAFDAITSRRSATPQGVGQPASQVVEQAPSQPGPHQEQDQDQEYPPSPPSGGDVWVENGRDRRRRGHPLDERRVLEPWSLDAFERFFACYPRPEARERALRVWRELNPSQELAALIVADVLKRVDGWAETEQRYIPFPAKYLSERRWQEPPPAPRNQRRSEPSRDGLPCFRTCPDCQTVLQGVYRGWQPVIPPCACSASETSEASETARA